MGKQVINIKNCNCIKQADIEIEEGTLNIKYGPNGTGANVNIKM
jgi:predicted ATP-binding protein involved in virulence